MKGFSDAVVRTALVDGQDVLRYYALPASDIADICRASESIAAIYERLARMIRQASASALSGLGIPSHLHEVIQTADANMRAVTIGRFDLVRSATGYKILEYNSDGPGLLRSAYGWQVCNPPRRHKVVVASSGLVGAVHDAVIGAFATVRREVPRRSTQSDLVLTALEGHSDAAATSEFLSRQLRDQFGIPSRFVPTEELRLGANTVSDARGRTVRVVYRMQALDCLLGGLLASSSSLPACGQQLAKHLRRRRLAMINHPMAYALSSKALQAVLWDLAVNRMWLSRKEQAQVLRYMLPSTTEQNGSHENDVVKAAYGRQGDSVWLKGTIRHNAAHITGNGHSRVLVRQKYVRPPTIRRRTTEGDNKLSVIMSCFMTGGRATALIARAGTGVTDNGWWVLPICARARTRVTRT